MIGGLRRAVVCLSFATFSFFVLWVDLAQGRAYYQARNCPLYTVLIPVLCAEALLAAGLWGAWELCRRLRWLDSAAVNRVFLLACLIPAGIGLTGVMSLAPVGRVFLGMKAVKVVEALLGAGVIGLAIWKPRSATRAVLSGFRWSAPPLAFVTAWGAVPVLRTSPAIFADGELQPPVRRRDFASQTRVVWVIFDELSQAVTFPNRPDGLDLPHFDRLRAESFYATAAHPTFAATKVAMPSLMLGMKLLDEVGTSPRSMRVQTGEGWRDFSEMANVFDSARQLGLNTGVAGWYLPYGRVLNRSLVKCYWGSYWVSPGIMEEADPNLPAAIWRIWRWQAGRVPLIGRVLSGPLVTLRRRLRIERYRAIQSQARELAADPTMGLVLLHLPVPHPPAYYSRKLGALVADGPITYFDNVALADRTLGELREAIERAGLWDRTALLVSADHGWRRASWSADEGWTPEEDELTRRVDTMGVPFLLKLPGQASGVRYDNEFNTVVTRRIITAILSGALKSADQVPGFIEAAGQDSKTN